MGRGGAAHVPTPPAAARPQRSRLGASAAQQIRSVVALAEQLVRARAGHSTVGLSQAHAAAACWWADPGPNKRLSGRMGKVDREIGALEKVQPGKPNPAAQQSFAPQGQAQQPAQPSRLRADTPHAPASARMLTALRLSKRQMAADHTERYAEAHRRQQLLEETELKLVPLSEPRIRSAAAFDLGRFVVSERAALFKLWSWLAEGHTPTVFIGALQGSIVAIDALKVEIQIWSLGLMDLPGVAHASGAPIPSSCLEKAWPTFDEMEHDLNQWKSTTAKIVRAQTANLTARNQRRALGLRPAKRVAEELIYEKDELERLRQRIQQLEGENLKLAQGKEEAERALRLCKEQQAPSCVPASASLGTVQKKLYAFMGGLTAIERAQMPEVLKTLTAS